MFNAIQNKMYETWAQTVFKASTLITDTVGLGFRPVWLDMFNYIQNQIGFNNLSKDARILVLNDFDLTATKAFREMGYKNIVMLVTDTTTEQTPTTYFFDVKFNDRKFRKLFPNGWSDVWEDVWFMNAVEVQNISDKGKPLKSTHIEYRIQGDTINMNFDLIIANPPYGKIGAQITDTIRKEVKYNHFVNLLPANDYKRVSNLHQYVRNMEAINNGFTDAAVTTHLCEIVKDPNSLTAEEFEIAQYIDPKLTKYFTEQLNRTHYAIDNATYKPKLKDFEINFDLRRCLFIGKRYISDEHIPYTKNCAGYKVNIGRTITPAELIAISAKSEQVNGNVGDFILAQFDTVQEQNNITNFLYSPQGFKFFAKVVVAMNLDSYAPLKKFIPKVDWTRSWTVEEILADYGYTETEIAEVIADLENFKDMERN
jgi:hypothetical protein